MPLDNHENIMHLQQDCGAEEAEQLLEWLLANPKGQISLESCSHLHTAVLQVLMAFRPKICAPSLTMPLDKLLQSAGVV
ncbi:hypothetical protein [Catenovulum sediminis]|uniref:Uncharacterized protein n=1 Tax=Catenovulum sediminis TaxID=1740262 RepID=A0ABV1RNI1_9ALTE|nr:hypothetical protein [Catenovulum sediminis]